MEPINDLEANHFLRHAEVMGSIDPQIYSFRDCRVCVSLDPAGKNRAPIWHVSVSRNRFPVGSDEAIEIAQAIMPSVVAWDVAIERVTHVWERT